MRKREREREISFGFGLFLIFFIFWKYMLCKKPSPGEKYIYIIIKKEKTQFNKNLLNFTPYVFQKKKPLKKLILIY